MQNSDSTNLPEHLKEIQAIWSRAAREEQDAIYANDFGPGFAPFFARLSLTGFIGDRPKIKALVSVLGLSWQPVALMAAWANPEHILLLGTRESTSMMVGSESVLQTICRVSGISRDRFTTIELDDEREELMIYREVRRFVDRHRLGPREVAIDPTGGKKSMSAAASLAGFLINAWIVYVDYREYLPKSRIPLAGTEYPRLLSNPLESFGDLDLDRIKEAYTRGNYEAASELANILATRLYEPREAEALDFLSRAYGAWHRFDFEKARETLQRLKNHLTRFAPAGKWSWSDGLLEKIQEQSRVLEELDGLSKDILSGQKPRSMKDGWPLIMNHLASAERAFEQGQYGVTAMLLYATLERYIDLALLAYYGLDDENPDYSALPLDKEKFDELGRKLIGPGYQERELAGPVSLATGAQLLATLKPEALPDSFFPKLDAVVKQRNRCEFEHGLTAKSLKRKKVQQSLEDLKEFLLNSRVVCGELGVGNTLERYRFPTIR